MNAGILSSTVKAFEAVDLPFLFNSGEEADKVMDGPFGTNLMKRLPDTGLIGLAYWELGFRNLTNNRHPVAKLEDITGLKIRTLQSPVPVALFNALGANAVPLPYTELFIQRLKPARSTGRKIRTPTSSMPNSMKCRNI